MPCGPCIIPCNCSQPGGLGQIAHGPTSWLSRLLSRHRQDLVTRSYPPVYALVHCCLESLYLSRSADTRAWSFLSCRAILPSGPPLSSISLLSSTHTRFCRPQAPPTVDSMQRSKFKYIAPDRGLRLAVSAALQPDRVDTRLSMSVRTDITWSTILCSL